MSTFNPEAFLNTETTEANATTYTPIPEGEYVACVKEIKARSTEKGQSILDVVWIIDSPEVEAATGMKSPTCKQSIFLDITESGGLDIGAGKNVQLGKVREALGQNQKGKPWRPGELIGQVARVTVKHRIYNDDIFAEVKGVNKS